MCVSLLITQSLGCCRCAWRFIFINAKHKIHQTLTHRHVAVIIISYLYTLYIKILLVFNLLPTFKVAKNYINFCHWVGYLFVFIPYATILKILSLNVETSRWHPRSLKLNKNCVNYYYHRHQFIGSKHDRVTCATKQSEHDIKDNDATNSCPRKVQVKKTIS